MVEIIEPYKGTIFDPACGSGGMFVQSSQFVDRRREELHETDTKDLMVYGCERTPETVKLAKMNLAVNGLRQASVHLPEAAIPVALRPPVRFAHQLSDVAVSARLRSHRTRRHAAVAEQSIDAPRSLTVSQLSACGEFLSRAELQTPCFSCVNGFTKIEHGSFVVDHAGGGIGGILQ